MDFIHFYWKLKHVYCSLEASNVDFEIRLYLEVDLQFNHLCGLEKALSPLKALLIYIGNIELF